MWWKIALAIVGGLAGLVLLMALIGFAIPKAHVATCKARFRQPPEVLWKCITDVDAFPSWRKSLTRVERLPDRDGKPVWVEHGRDGRMTIETIESVPPTRLVGRIADKDLPFGGTWTYEIARDGDGATLTLTEAGEIYNPIFRFMARTIFGYHATMKGYLTALGEKFGEPVNPEIVR
ncbi:MAG: SRPBCC family protein [Phycisphaerae bacterium]|nr:SRPBCC family protein [Phycisphaerae bacterium]